LSAVGSQKPDGSHSDLEYLKSQISNLPSATLLRKAPELFLRAAAEDNEKIVAGSELLLPLV
jgi:hypothetical protein